MSSEPPLCRLGGLPARPGTARRRHRRRESRLGRRARSASCRATRSRARSRWRTAFAGRRACAGVLLAPPYAPLLVGTSLSEVRLSNLLVRLEVGGRAVEDDAAPSRERIRDWQPRAPSARFARREKIGVPRWLISTIVSKIRSDEHRSEAHRRLVEHEQFLDGHHRAADRAHLLLATRQRSCLLRPPASRGKSTKTRSVSSFDPASV